MKKQTIIIVFVMLFSKGVFAVPPVTNIQNAPIDAGILLLAAAGVSYGIYQLHKKRQKL